MLIDRNIYNDKAKHYKKINIALYAFFLDQYKNNDYDFIYSKDLYPMVLEKNLYMSYEFNIIKYVFTNHPNQAISKKVFNENQKEMFDKLKPNI